MRGFLDIPCCTLAIETEFFRSKSILGGILQGLAQSMGRRALPANGRREGAMGSNSVRVNCLWELLSGLPTGSGPETERQRPRGGARRWCRPERASQNA